MVRYRGLLVILLLHILLSAVYDYATPRFEASDEGFHYGFVQWVADQYSLPVQDPEVRDTWWEQEGSQPPLYYWLAAQLVRPLDTTDFETVFVRNPLSRLGVPGTTHNVNLYRHPLESTESGGTTFAVKAVRWFSIILSCFTIYFTYSLALLVGANKNVAHLTAAFVAFNPMTIFINASVNNDNLIMLLGAATLALLIRQLRQPKPSLDRSTLLGVLLAFAALTKLSGLTLFPIVLVTLLVYLWNQRQDQSPGTKVILHILALSVPPLLIASWWYLRNGVLYGELFGTKTMVMIAGARPPISLIELISTEWRGFFLSFWGIFGAFSIVASEWIYRLFYILTCALLVGFALLLLRLLRAKRHRTILRLGPLVAIILLTVITLLTWTLQTYASQGRLLFSALAAIAVLMALGLQGLLGSFPISSRATAQIHWALIAGLAAVALYIPLFNIIPAYAAPRSLTEGELPPSIRRVNARLAETIHLLGYSYDETVAQPGGTQRITLYWELLQPTQNDYKFSLILRGQNNDEVGTIDSWPGAGLAATSQVQPGRIIEDRYRIDIDADAQMPSLLRLDVGLWLESHEAPLPVILDGTAEATFAQLPVGRLAESTNPVSPAGSTRFGDSIWLQRSEQRREGDTLVLTLTWLASDAIPTDYTTFLHIIDASGALVAQFDAPPPSMGIGRRAHGSWASRS